MITFEEALEIAKQTNPTVNYCLEERFLWVFYDKFRDESPENPPIVVIKREGKNMPLDIFKRDYLYKRRFVREFYLEDFIVDENDY